MRVSLLLCLLLGVLVTVSVCAGSPPVEVWSPWNEWHLVRFNVSTSIASPLDTVTVAPPGSNCADIQSPRTDLCNFRNLTVVGEGDGQVTPMQVQVLATVPPAALFLCIRAVEGTEFTDVTPQKAQLIVFGTTDFTPKTIQRETNCTIMLTGFQYSEWDIVKVVPWTVNNTCSATSLFPVVVKKSTSTQLEVQFEVPALSTAGLELQMCVHFGGLQDSVDKFLLAQGTPLLLSGPTGVNPTSMHQDVPQPLTVVGIQLDPQSEILPFSVGSNCKGLPSDGLVFSGSFSKLSDSQLVIDCTPQTVGFYMLCFRGAEEDYFSPIPGDPMNVYGTVGIEPQVLSFSGTSLVTIYGQFLGHAVQQNGVKAVNAGVACVSQSSGGVVVTLQPSTAEQIVLQVEPVWSGKYQLCICLEDPTTFEAVNNGVFSVEGATDISPDSFLAGRSSVLTIFGNGLGTTDLIKIVSSTGHCSDPESPGMQHGKPVPGAGGNLEVTLTANILGQYVVCISFPNPSGQRRWQDDPFIPVQNGGFSVVGTSYLYPDLLGINSIQIVTIVGFGFPTSSEAAHATVSLDIMMVPSTAACSATPSPDVSVSSIAVSSVSEMVFGASSSTSGVYQVCLQLPPFQGFAPVANGVVAFSSTGTAGLLPSKVPADATTSVTIFGAGLDPSMALVAVLATRAEACAGDPTSDSSITIGSVTGTSQKLTAPVHTTDANTYIICLQSSGGSTPVFSSVGSLNVGSFTPTVSNISPTSLPWRASQTITVTGQDMLSIEDILFVTDASTCQGNGPITPVPGVTVSTLIPSRVADTSLSLSLAVTVTGTLRMCCKFSGFSYSTQGPELTIQAPSATFISPTAILPNLNWVLTVVGNNIPQDGMNALRIVDPHMTTCEASSASSPAFVIQNVDTNGPQRLLAAILSTAKGIYQVCVCFSGADSFIPVPSGSLSVQDAVATGVVPRQIVVQQSTLMSIVGQALSPDVLIMVVDSQTLCSSGVPSKKASVSNTIWNAPSLITTTLLVSAPGTFQFCISYNASAVGYTPVNDGDVTASVPSPSSVFPTDIAVNVTTVITVFGSNLQLGDGSDFVVVDSETSCDGHSSVTGLSSFSVGPLVKVGDNLQVSLSGVVKGSFVSCIRVPGIENYSSLQPRLVVQDPYAGRISAAPLAVFTTTTVTVEGQALSAVDRVFVVNALNNNQNNVNNNNNAGTRDAALAVDLCIGATSNAPNVTVTNLHLDPITEYLLFDIQPNRLGMFSVCVGFVGNAMQTVGDIIYSISPAINSFQPSLLPSTSAASPTLTVLGTGLRPADTLRMTNDSSQCSMASPTPAVGTFVYMTKAEMTEAGEVLTVPITVSFPGTYYFCVLFPGAPTWQLVSGTMLAKLPLASSLNPKRIGVDIATPMTISGFGLQAEDTIVVINADKECSSSNPSSGIQVTDQKLVGVSLRFNLQASGSGSYRVCIQYSGAPDSSFQQVTSDLLTVELSVLGGSSSMPAWEITLIIIFVVPTLVAGAGVFWVGRKWGWYQHCCCRSSISRSGSKGARRRRHHHHHHSQHQQQGRSLLFPHQPHSSLGSRPDILLASSSGLPSPADGSPLGGEGMGSSSAALRGVFHDHFLEEQRTSGRAVLYGTAGMRPVTRPPHRKPPTLATTTTAAAASTTNGVPGAGEARVMPRESP